MRILVGGLAVAACLAGCDRKPTTAAPPPPDQLRKLMKGEVAPAKPPPLRLAALWPHDLRELPAGPRTCRFTRGPETLVVARGAAAIAKVDGQVRRIPRAGPVDATGAFFQAPTVTISIGAPDPRLGDGPASATIAGGAPDDAPQKAEGVWSCTGPA
jgi:hypothetical protein